MSKGTRRSVPIVLLLLLVSLPVAAQYRMIGGKNKVRYDTFEWLVYETPHFRISYYDRVEPKLERVASFAESSYDELARRLNFQILDPIPMIVYATHAEFEQTNIISGFIPEGVGAFASPVRNRMVLPLDLPDRELQALIQHELTHIFQYEILFQGKRGRALYARPPLWFMEGMASYYGNDESSRDEMYMRDAVLADIVPSVAAPIGGFLAYRFGHKVFEFIEDEWGEDGVRDFVFANRGGMGGNIARPIGKTFNISVEEFDAEFKRWLKKKYEPFNDRGTPRDFGQPFEIIGSAGRAHQSSPTVSPSGDLVAAFTTYKRDIDVAIFGIPDRKLVKNLTSGYTTKYEYLIAQGFTVGPAEGRDLAYSPDGNYVAVFARTERTRSLLLLDAHKGGIARRYDIPLPVDQSAQPAYSPDGRTIAFQATNQGVFDIYLLDVESGDIRNLTDDKVYDASPTYSPDGKYIVYSSHIGDYGKLVRISLDDPSDRDQITFGEGNDEGAAFSDDGERLFFASDRLDGVFDVYRLDLDSHRLERITFVIGAAINPVPGEALEGERVGFQAYHRGRWDLFVADANEGEFVGYEEPIGEEVVAEAFLPAVSINVDPADGKKVKKRRLFIEDANALVGVNSDGTFLSQTYFSFSDQYGDRRMLILFDSIDTFANFRISYANLEKKLQWGATLYDSRTFYITGFDFDRGEVTDRQNAYRVSGASFDVAYPLSRYYRVVGNLGYFNRSASLPAQDPDTGQTTFQSSSDQAPLVSGAIVGDTTLWNYYGPHQGSRFEFRLTYAHDMEDGGALTQQFQVDARKYLAITQRSELALRLFGAFADGNRPSIFGIGGTDTVRGYRIRSIAGNEVAFANVEYRFPLIDRLDFSFMRVGEIRGRVFTDIGYSCYSYVTPVRNRLGEPGCVFMGPKDVFDPLTGEMTTIGKSGRLTDGVASYGVGLTVYLFGLPFHWDWIQRWNFSEELGDTEVDFWIGLRF